MKSMRDSLRKLDQFRPPPEQIGSPSSKVDDPWHCTLLNVIFMLFLGYESGRKAIEHLVEFQPTQAETRIVILLTELNCYAFLRREFARDDGDRRDQWNVRHRRLELRLAAYREQIPDLWVTFEPYQSDDPDWL